MTSDIGNVLLAAGVLSAVASALCAIRASLLVTPLHPAVVPLEGTTSAKTAQLIRLLRDYTWASRDVVEVLKTIVHQNAPIDQAFEAHRLELSNAIRKYLGGSERAEHDLRESGMLDFTPEISSAASARSWLQLGGVLALLSAGLQLAAMLAK
jgi:hypothetical protein